MSWLSAGSGQSFFLILLFGFLFSTAQDVMSKICMQAASALVYVCFEFIVFSRLDAKIWVDYRINCSLSG